VGTSRAPGRPKLPWSSPLIFLTVGSQMPFDRLVTAADAWARDHPDVAILAQIGAAQYAPLHMQVVATLAPASFAEKCQAAHLIVAHAGMGSILTALQYGKPIVVMPRKGSLRETRNDHQMAAAKWLRSINGVYFADDEAKLSTAIDAAIAKSLSPEPIAAKASASLLDGLRQFIDGPGRTGKD
jgi:UDP-N-acetylglucosamine transferase subunit ALG13